MDVCMVLPDPYPPDVRVAKEVDALLDAGHDVTLFSGGFEGPRRETVDGVEVVRVYRGGRFPEARRLGCAAYHLLSNVYPNWRRELDRALEEGSYDVLHVHDLPLLETALGVGSDHDVPVVADLHENYPEAVRQWRRPYRGRAILGNPRQLAHRVLQPIRRMKRVEERCVRRADRVVAVVEEAERHFVEDCGASPERTTVVSNVVDRSTFDPSTVEPAGPDDGAFVATYVGGFAPHRGLETAIEAMPSLLERVPNARLVLAGAGDDAFEERLRSTAARLDVAEHVTFTGWVDFERVPAHVAASDVCLVPHAVNPHTDTTIPHKLFQYMAMGKPVVVSDADPLERVVSETASGVVVPGREPERLADAVAALAERPDRASELGANGRRAVEREYNWQRERETLLEMYDSLPV